MLRADDIAVLQFSGGKDSLACLYLLREHWDRLIVAWVNTGAAYPETVALMERVRKMMPNFLEIQSDQPSNVVLNGPPSDIAPIRNMPQGRVYTQYDGAPIQSFLECCSVNIWQPMADAVKTLKATVIIRGQKLSDQRKSALRDGDFDGSVRYWFPIESWSDDDVRAYLRAQDVELPAHYAYTKTSLDCWSCTAYLDENFGRLRHMRKEQPEMWQKIEPRIRTILAASQSEVRNLYMALG